MRIRKSGLAAVAAALFAVVVGGAFSLASAQGAFYPKKVPLVFNRNSQSSADNPNAVPALQPYYQIGRADGNHGANSGSALALRDTSAAIFVGDHWLKSTHAYRAGAAAISVGDTSWSGTLMLKANRSTIDSVVVTMQLSQDGSVWTSCDSVSLHIISQNSMQLMVLAGDSLAVILGTVTGAAGGVGTAGAVSFTANPWWHAGGVTAQAIQAVNFVRFIMHMTPGDFAASTNVYGVTGEFLYPSVDANNNALGRISQ
jgi:hypothetical protein